MATTRTRQGYAPGVPTALQDAAGWSWRLLVIGAAVTFVGIFARRMELVVIPLLTALLLTALLAPVTNRLEQLRLPRAVASIVTVLLGITVLGGIGAFVVNRANAGYPQLVDQVGHLVDHTQRWLESGPLHLKQSGDLGGRITDALQSRKGQVASGVLSAGRTIADVVTGIVLTLFLTLFMLYDGRRIWAWLTGLVADANRERTDRVGQRMWRTLSGYVTGTFLVALFHGAVMGTTLAILGVPLVAPLVVLVFIGGFIPRAHRRKPDREPRPAAVRGRAPRQPASDGHRRDADLRRRPGRSARGDLRRPARRRGQRGRRRAAASSHGGRLAVGRCRRARPLEAWRLGVAAPQVAQRAADLAERGLRADRVEHRRDRVALT
jgi:branched-subunit amino acid transport protein